MIGIGDAADRAFDPAAAQRLDSASFSIRKPPLLRGTCERQSLRFAPAAEVSDAFARSQVDGLERIGSQGGDEQQAVVRIDGRVIPPTLDSGQLDAID